MPIWPHNEYGWSTVNPAWLTFSNLGVPTSGMFLMKDFRSRQGGSADRVIGGETPINSSLALALAIQKQAPEFYKQLLQKGIRYVYRYRS